MKTKKYDWIICSQQKEVLSKYYNPQRKIDVVFVMVCKRCGKERPVYEGTIDDVVKQSEAFAESHKCCKKPVEINKNVE